jgi:hypothetical protein
VYVLFEHKSTSSWQTAVQLLGYVARILNTYVRNEEDNAEALPLPPIIPVVLHHSEKGWTAPKELRPLFGKVLDAVPELEPWLPSLSFVVDDISHVSDAELRARTLGAFPSLTLWALRDARSPGKLLETMGHWADAFVELVGAPNGGEALAVLFRYISLVADELEVDQLREMAERVAPQVEATIMTIAEQMRREGRAEGRQEGRAEGRLEGEARVIQSLLEQKFGTISAETRTRIQGATEEQLTRWLERILAADSVEAVFGE